LDEALVLPNGSSAAQSLYQMLCFTLGAGMLGLPHAVLFAKEFFFLPVTVGFACCLYSALLLHDVQLQHGLKSYQALGDACGGQWTGVFVGVTLSINQFGIAILYVITVCNNMQLMLGRNETYPSWYWYLIVGLVCSVASTRGKGLQHASCISFLGLVSVLAVGVLVLAAPISKEPPKTHPVGFSQALAGLGVTIFAYGGHPVYPEVQGNMTKPEEFSLVINAAFIVMLVLFLLVTHCSWKASGEGAQVYLLDDLEASWMRSGALAGITVHLIAAIPICLLPMMRYVESHCASVSFYLVRVGIVSMAIVIGYLVPFFGDFLSLVGSFSENALVFIFPIVFYHITFKREVFFLRTLIHIVLLGVSLPIFFVGSSTAVSNIVAKWSQYHFRLE